MKRIFFCGLFLFSLIFISCEKEPGEGGTNTITGKLFVKDYNSAGILKDEYFARDERVYIIYGDNASYSDFTRTNFDGTYQFHFLYPGKYTLFAYSKCLSCPGEEEAIFETIEIEGKGQDIEIPLITIND